MIEEDTNWFSKWEEQLPSPDELMPISQSLITPDLALAFDIKPPFPSPSQNYPLGHLRRDIHHPPIHAPSLNHGILPLNTHNSSEFADSSDLGGSATPGSGPSDEPARTLKRPRLVWTPQLHKRFVDAVGHLGIKNAVPKTIMQLMSVDGLTRENVASHLQKYRLYLKRMQGSSSPGGNGALGVNGSGPVVDPATDHLFASGPVPPHFLPYVPVTAMHQHAQMGGAAASVHPQMQMQMQMHNYRQVGGGHFGSSVTVNGQYENHHHFLGREAQPAHHHRVGGGGGVRVGGIQPFGEDLESEDGNNGGNRKILTLFPTGDD